MTNLKLYNYFRSSTSYRARLALEYKSLSYEYLPVHLVNNGGEQNSPEYRKINPMGGVPTLVHNNQYISQSMAICEYLDEAFPQTNKIFPQDLYLKSKVRQICEMINADIHPLQNLKVTAFLEKEFGINVTQKQQWLNKWISEGLAALEKTIKPLAGNSTVGDEVTAADLFLIPQLFSSRRFNVDVTPFETLLKIEEKCNSLNAFKKAHPFRQPDTPPEFRN